MSQSTFFSSQPSFTVEARDASGHAKNPEATNVAGWLQSMKSGVQVAVIATGLALSMASIDVNAHEHKSSANDGQTISTTIGQAELTRLRGLAESALDQSQIHKLSTLDVIDDLQKHQVSGGPVVETIPSKDRKMLSCTINMKDTDPSFGFVGLDPKIQNSPERVQRIRDLTLLHEAAHCDVGLSTHTTFKGGDETSIRKGFNQMNDWFKKGVLTEHMATSLNELVDERFSDAKALLIVANRTIDNNPNKSALNKDLRVFDQYAVELLELRSKDLENKNYRIHDSLSVVKATRAMVLGQSANPKDRAWLLETIGDNSRVNALAYSIAFGSVVSDLPRLYPSMIEYSKGQVSSNLESLRDVVGIAKIIIDNSPDKASEDLRDTYAMRNESEQAITRLSGEFEKIEKLSRLNQFEIINTFAPENQSDFVKNSKGIWATLKKNSDQLEASMPTVQSIRAEQSKTIDASRSVFWKALLPTVDKPNGLRLEPKTTNPTR